MSEHLAKFIRDARDKARSMGFVRTIHGRKRYFGESFIRVNDRMRVIDPRHENFDDKGYVTCIEGARYYVVLDSAINTVLNASQIQKEDA